MFFLRQSDISDVQVQYVFPYRIYGRKGRSVNVRVSRSLQEARLGHLKLSEEKRFLGDTIFSAYKYTKENNWVRCDIIIRGSEKIAEAFKYHLNMISRKLKLRG